MPHLRHPLRSPLRPPEHNPQHRLQGFFCVMCNSKMFLATCWGLLACYSCCPCTWDPEMLTVDFAFRFATFFLCHVLFWTCSPAQTWPSCRPLPCCHSRCPPTQANLLGRTTSTFEWFLVHQKGILGMALSAMNQLTMSCSRVMVP